MKKRSAVILTAVLMSVTALFIGGCGNTTAVSPTFMYFYTNADTETVEPLIEELQSKYAKEVNFELVNVDEDSEALENFALVQGNTPALIMLNTSNDISAMEFQCTDKDKLTEDIEAALK